MRIEPGIAGRVPTPVIFGTDPIAARAALVSADATPSGRQIRFSEKPKFVTARSAAKRRINGPGDESRRISRCNRNGLGCAFRRGEKRFNPRGVRHRCRFNHKVKPISPGAGPRKSTKR